MARKAILEVSVVFSQEDPISILKLLQAKYERLHEVKTNLKTEGKPTLKLVYKSEKSMKENFFHDVPFFEAVLEVFEANGITPANKILEIEETYDEKIDYTQSMYQILKYKTRYKEILRDYYNFIFRVSELLDTKYAYEEMEDGFLIFHKKPEDFELFLIDLTNRHEIHEYLKSKGLLTQFLEENLLKSIFKRMEKKKKDFGNSLS